jgi:hypothetical protein
MKTTIIRFAVRVAVFSTIAGFLGVVSSRNDNQDAVALDLNIARVRASARHGDLDLLFLGSSYTANAVNSPLLNSAGYSAYNLGVSSSGPGFFELLLQDHIKATGSKPKIVVMELTLITFAPGCDNWAIYAIHRYLNDPVSNEEVLFRFREIKKYPDMFGASFRKSIGNTVPIAGISGRRDAAKFEDMVADMDENKGFHETSGMDSDEVWEQEKQFFVSVPATACNPHKVAHLKRLLRTLTEEGIPVILHELPTSEVQNVYNNEYTADYRHQVDLLAEEFPVLRVHDKTFEDKKYFRNADHMNDVGARTYTQFLISGIEELANSGVIPLDRSLPASSPPE